MNVAIESPPPHTKRTLPENNCCAAEVDAQEVLNSNKRRLADSLGAGVRGVGPGLANHGLGWFGEHSQSYQNQFVIGADLSPSENSHVNSGNVPYPGVPLSKRTRYQEEAAYFQQQRDSHQGQQGQHINQHNNQQGHTYRNSGVQETLYKALKALFPSMRDETIAQVLEACGDDVDAAIRRLNELKLEGGEHEHGDRNGKMCQGADFGRKSMGDGEEEQASASRKEAKIEIKPAWVDALVSEMSQAKDVEDAKRRAAGMLGRVLEDHAQGSSGGHEASVDLHKENALLKRAVGIQNNKIHELGEKCKGVEELVAKFEEVKGRCQALEMQNYSLQVHLKEATSRWQPNGNDETGGRNPDVY